MTHENTHPGDSKGPHDYDREYGYSAIQHEHREYPKALTLADGSTRIVESAEEEARFTSAPEQSRW